MAVPFLDKTRPLAQGLVFCAAQGYPVDLVTGAKGTLLGAPSNVGRHRYGASFEGFTVNTDAYWWPNTAFRSIGDKLTIVIVASLDGDSSNFTTLLSVEYRDDGTYTTPYTVFNLNHGFAGGGQMISVDFTKAGPTRDFDEQAIIWPGSGSLDSIVGWTQNNGAGRYYQNGVAVGAASSEATGLFDLGTSKRISLFTGASFNMATAAPGTNGRVPYVALWRRPLSAAEHRLIAANPMRLVTAKAPPLQYGPFPIVASAAAGAPAASGVVSARVAVVGTQAGSRQTSGQARATATGTTTTAGARATSGVVSARVAVVVRTTGTQGAAIGGAIRAVVAATATTTASRATTGAANSPAAVVSRQAGSRATSGQAKAVVVVVSRQAGTTGAVVAGVVSARVAVVSRQVGTKAATGGASATAASVFCRSTGKRGAIGASRAGVTAFCRTSATRATTGACRAGVTATGHSSCSRATTGASRAVGVAFCRTTGTQVIVVPPPLFPSTPRNGPYAWGAFMWGATIPAAGLLIDMGPWTDVLLESDGSTTFEFTDPPGFSTIMLSSNGITWVASREGDALADFWIKEGDRLPPLAGALVGSNGQRINLSTSTVRFKCRVRDTAVVHIDQPMSIVDAVEGEVSYAWTAADTLAAVELQGEIQVTDGGGLVQTFPRPGFLEIHVVEDV